MQSVQPRQTWQAIVTARAERHATMNVRVPLGQFCARIPISYDWTSMTKGSFRLQFNGDAYCVHIKSRNFLGDWRGTCCC